MDNLNQQMLQSAQAVQEELAAWRRELHRHPELGFDLTFTKAFVKARLVEMGCEPQDCGRAGVVVLLGKEGGKTVLIRGDMDALPIEEQADVPYKSEIPGRMHACGHDMHTTMLLGAARLLKQYEDRLEGQVKLMFQPAEEIMTGAKDMVESGVLENPHVDVAMMLHVMSGMPVPAGCIMLPNGGTGMASSDHFRITVKGKGGHGGMPNMAIDPISALAHIHLSIQEIHAREVAPGEYLVITPGMFHAGDACNIIPDTAYLEGTIRTADEKTVDFAKKRIREIAEATATAFRCTAEVVFDDSIPPMLADADVVKDARAYLTEILGKAVLPPMNYSGKVIGGGSEDFAYVTTRVPGVGGFLSAGNSEEGYCYSQHHPCVSFDDSVLYRGSAAYAYFAFRWLQEHK